MPRDAYLLKESFTAIEDKADKVAGYFYARLFTKNPSLREMFPVMMDTQRSRLVDAIVQAVQGIDNPEVLVPFLRQLGRDHRKFGVIAEHYDAVGSSLVEALRVFSGDAWSAEIEAAWVDAYGLLARTMIDAANMAEADMPAWWDAEVVSHERRAHDLAVITVRPDQPFPYRAGQFASLECSHRPRMWRYFSMANAPRTDGLLEFHIRAVGAGWVSSALVWHGKIGDTLRLGPPLGALTVDPGSSRDVLLLAGGTGLAPLRSLVEDMARWNHMRQVYLFFGARRPDDLYDMAALQRLQIRNHWLTVVPAVSEDPTYRGEKGNVCDVMTEWGDWEEHDVVLAGSPDMVRATLRKLSKIGIPPSRIRFDAYGDL
jgi:NAD(P)H-flavin reductase/hemoglobin-like flavoprotein